mgnify:CR=1 FL=1|tara:strand:+ start:30 stop:221 length:192 start_codon:yes stop_codon:yes gene_type:complete
MTDDNVAKLIQMNQRLLLVMGYATSVILDLGKNVPEKDKQGVYWVIEAIENIVHLYKPLPPIP